MQNKANLQDIFLLRARRDAIPVTMFLMNGFQMRGVITGYDAFVVILDSDGKQQNFTNLIIIYTDITDLNDAKSRVTFDLDEGNGIYVSNGTYKNITWKKGNATDTLKFFNEDGSELSLNPGRSYIGIVGTGREKLTEIA